MKYTSRIVRHSAQIAALFLVSGQVHAATSVPITQFSGVAKVIDFQTPASNEALITTQYLGLGVSFSGSLFTMQNPGDTVLFPSNGDGQIASNWRYFGGQLQGLQFVISLSSFAERIGFDVEQGTDVAFSISLFNQSVLVDSVNFAAVAGPVSVQFAGVEELSGFDQAVVTVSGGNGFIAIDNLRIDTVPEPSSALLLALSAFAFTTHRRRNR